MSFYIISDSSDEEVVVSIPPSMFDYAKPVKCIMHNLPTVINRQGQTQLAWSIDWVITTLKNSGLTMAKSIHPAYNMDGSFLGYAAIEFEFSDDPDEQAESFRQALKLERVFLDMIIRSSGLIIMKSVDGLIYGWLNVIIYILMFNYCVIVAVLMNPFLQQSLEVGKTKMLMGSTTRRMFLMI